MMNARRLAFFLVVSLAGLAFGPPSIGQQPDQIIVNNADELIETLVSVSPDLLSHLAPVTSRVVVEYANYVRHNPLIVVPPPLQAQLDQLTARVVVEYANAINREDLVQIPAELQQRLDQLTPRIVFEYANANRHYELFYPAGMLNDTTAPTIEDISAQRGNHIIWTTDEFADSTVLYGTASSVYSYSVSDPLYAKQHDILLPGLTPGVTYYYVVRSTDRSGNTSTSEEHSFKAVISSYLPVVLKGWP